VLQLLTTSNSHECLLPSLRQLNAVRESLGFRRLEVVYFDNARKDEFLWIDAFPDLCRPTSVSSAPLIASREKSTLSMPRANIEYHNPGSMIWKKPIIHALLPTWRT
jgi:hypothetical protein